MSRTYKSWDRMIQRCTNPKSNKFHIYGAKGIKVCERWGLFDNFLADMGERPPGTTLNRKDNSLGYYKENCNWATPLQQGRNRSNNAMYEHDGKRLCMSEWAELLGIGWETLYQRLRRHSFSEAVEMTTKKRTWKPTITTN